MAAAKRCCSHDVKPVVTTCNPLLNDAEAARALLAGTTFTFDSHPTAAFPSVYELRPVPRAHNHDKDHSDVGGDGMQPCDKQLVALPRFVLSEVQRPVGTSQRHGGGSAGKSTIVLCSLPRLPAKPSGHTGARAIAAARALTSAGARG